MAWTPPKRCVHPLCNEVASHRGYCDYHKPTYKKTNTDSKLKRERDKFYNTKAWTDFRIKILYKTPLCEYCQKNMVLTDAEHVDHILRRSHYEGSDFDQSNIQALCKECHSHKTNREQKYYDNNTWNTDANPYYRQWKKNQSD
jgi:5-methylcytosine-specific restriction protein A